MVPAQPSSCSHDGRQQCCGARSSPGSARLAQDTMSPASPTRMRRQLGQPLDQSGSNMGQFVPLGCSQPSPQHSYRPHPAGLGALELKGRLEPAAGWGLLDLGQSWGTSSTALAAELVVPQCLLTVLFLRRSPKTPQCSLPSPAPPRATQVWVQMGMLWGQVWGRCIPC